MPKYCVIGDRINLSAEDFNNAAFLPASCISASLLMLIIDIIVIKKDQGKNECKAAGHSLVYAKLERFNLENPSENGKCAFSPLKILVTETGKNAVPGF